MERKIGETFEFEGKTLQVKESSSSGCNGCFFDEQRILCSKNVAGYCDFKFRTDKKKVIFVEATEQEQAEQPKLNLCEILKDCPKGTKFYTSIWGKVEFEGINDNKIYPIIVRLSENETENLTANGKMYEDLDGECILFPSREQRDWSKFTAPWYKKERFNPKTLKAFDKVLVFFGGEWQCDFFSHMLSGDIFNKRCMGVGDINIVIPYNEDTKHLVGTTDEAPQYYRYWEDC